MECLDRGLSRQPGRTVSAPLPLDTMIQRVSNLLKIHCRAVYDKVVESTNAVPRKHVFALRDAIQALADPLTLPPLLTHEASIQEVRAPA